MDELEYRVGRFTLRPNRQLLDGDTPVSVGRKALELLSALARANGALATKDELMASVWPNVIVEENAIQAHIAALRKVLGEDATLLKTVHGLGYRLAVSVRTMPPETPQTDRGVSICVLPFANLSGAAEQEYFADGVTEDIITDLSKVSALSVIARTTALTFKGRPVDIRQVARRLKVSHVLEGSVRKSGERVRITAQLIDGSTNSHVWAERYDRNLDDIFALQDEIAEAIVSALKVSLFPEEKQAIGQRGTTNFEAYDLYLRAQSLARTFAPDKILRAIEIYRQVLALTSDFAAAWVGLANALRRARLIAAGDDTQMLAELAEALDRAQALAPDAWTTHLSHAGQLRTRRDYRGAERAIARAVELAPPSEPDVLTSRGMFLAHLGRTREAIGILQSALRVEPLSLETSFSLQMVLDNVPQRAEAQAEYERSKDLAGDRGVVEFYEFMRLWGHESLDGIKQQFDRCLSYETLIMPVHRELREVMDEPTAALALIRRAHDDPTYQDQLRQSVLSFWAALHGDNGLAFAAMRRSLFELNALTLAWLWHPLFADLRKDPRFKGILRELGFVDYWRASGKWGDFVRPVGEDDFEVFA